MPVVHLHEGVRMNAIGHAGMCNHLASNTKVSRPRVGNPQLQRAENKLLGLVASARQHQPQCRCSAGRLKPNHVFDDQVLRLILHAIEWLREWRC